jgi:hypothetical protein
VKAQLAQMGDAENDLRQLKVKRENKRETYREEWASVIKEAKALTAKNHNLKVYI